MCVYARRMDVLAGLLDGPRAQEAFLLRAVLTPPWSLRIEDEAPVSVFAVTAGHVWFVPDQGEPVRLGPGDVALVRGPEPYTVADEPGTATTVVVHPGQACTTIGGDELAQRLSLGVRTWGTAEPDDPGATTMLVGTYEHCGEMSRRLLHALPSHLALHGDPTVAPLLDVLSREIVRDEPGQQVVLDRLLDLLLVTTLRAWCAGEECAVDGHGPAHTSLPLLAAHHDPVVGPALRLLHDHPAEPWTVASLASVVGVSRASLARRFHDAVGEPPMRYLTTWRLAMAADLLCEPGATVGAVAQQVGYGSPFALSAAFKREHGVSPQEHRAACSVAA